MKKHTILSLIFATLLMQGFSQKPSDKLFDLNQKADLFTYSDNCFGLNTQFKTNLKADSITWNFDDIFNPNNIARGNNVSHKFNKPGAYNVSITTWSNGKANVHSKIVTIKSIPQLNLNIGSGICEGKTELHNIIRTNAFKYEPKNFNPELANSAYNKIIRADGKCVNENFVIYEITSSYKPLEATAIASLRDIYEDNVLNRSGNPDIYEDNVLNKPTNPDIYEDNVLNRTANPDIYEDNVLNSTSNPDIYEDNVLNVVPNGDIYEDNVLNLNGNPDIYEDNVLNLVGNPDIYEDNVLNSVEFDKDTLKFKKEISNLFEQKKEINGVRKSYLKVALPKESYFWNSNDKNLVITQCKTGLYFAKANKLNSAATKRTKVLIPNIFTPNYDGINDKFRIAGNEGGKMALSIFSNSGSLIYTTENYNNDWAAEGNEDGLYFYIVNDKLNSKIYKGTVKVSRGNK